MNSNPENRNDNYTQTVTRDEPTPWFDEVLQATVKGMDDFVEKTAKESPVTLENGMTMAEFSMKAMGEYLATLPEIDTVEKGILAGMIMQDRLNQIQNPTADVEEIAQMLGMDPQQTKSGIVLGTQADLHNIKKH
jgi:hypothetical protein